jgi:hypothetical protein
MRNPARHKQERSDGNMEAVVVSFGDVGGEGLQGPPPSAFTTLKHVEEAAGEAIEYYDRITAGTSTFCLRY